MTARGVARHLAFPVLWGGSMAAAWAWLARGGAPFVVMVVVCGIATAAVIALERLLPYRRAWHPDWIDFRLDATHMVLSCYLLESLPTLLQATLVAGGAHLAALWGGGLWPTGAPMAVQFLLATLITQLSYYAWHRAQHSVPILWRSHAVHHSVGRIYWLNALRVHPLESLGGVLTGPVLLIALGVPAEVMTLYGVSLGVYRFLEHANIDLAWGPFSVLFNTSVLHRWHHSNRPEEANANYGSMLSLWDFVFGTRRVFEGPEPEAGLGTGGAVPVPRSYLQHLLLPLRWRPDYTAPAGADLRPTPVGRRSS
jgi:sterol desaturase/sphingolipid hydroxylase (fatty acid hydroxylase superfamily)